MPVNLRSVQRALEREMVDTVTIHRMTGETGEVYDEETMQYTEAAQTDPLYDGKALIGTDRRDPIVRDEGGTEQSEELYNLSLPVGSVEAEGYDIVECTSSLRNPALVGKKWFVREQIYVTMPVADSITMVRRVGKREP